MIELPVVMDGKKTEEQDEGKGNPGGERRAQWLSQSAEEKAACNRCDGIDVHVKDDGHAARHHIADDAASDSGDEPQHNGKDDVVARIAVEPVTVKAARPIVSDKWYRIVMIHFPLFGMRKRG